MVNTYAVQSGGCRFESLWGFGFCLKGAHYEVDYCGKKNFLSWTAMHIDFVMCKNRTRLKGPSFQFSKIFVCKWFPIIFLIFWNKMDIKNHNGPPFTFFGIMRLKFLIFRLKTGEFFSTQLGRRLETFPSWKFQKTLSEFMLMASKVCKDKDATQNGQFSTQQKGPILKT